MFYDVQCVKICDCTLAIGDRKAEIAKKQQNKQPLSKVANVWKRNP